MQHLRDVGKNALHEPRFVERLPARQPHAPFDVVGPGCRQTKRQGHHDLDLVEIGHIINKAEHLAGVDEPQGRRIAGRDNAGMANPI